MKKALNLFRPSLSMRNAGGCEKKMPAYGRFWRNTTSRSHSSNLRTGLESKVPKPCHRRRGKNERRRESRYFEAFSAGEKMSMRDGGRVRMAGWDIHRRRRRIGRRLIGAGRKTGRKSIRRRESFTR